MTVLGGLVAGPALAILGAFSTSKMEKSETMPRLITLKLKQPSKKRM
ncbi:hypothetical protein HPHPH42_0895 [Helicobacter pylori Hp H-42]|uniref:Uncharacterized protein n=1 Tax=Helicobacter pylori Hp H-42 TaxID=992047 RepID=A0AB33XH46_HELPX|nr:hypothetical protein HPHPH42_0895 [Helicobacter pylori Hp H-42]